MNPNRARLSAEQEVTEQIVHENDNYKVVVGYPPPTRDIPRPWPSYLIINKMTAVCEVDNHVLPMAIQWADHMNNLLVKPGSTDIPDPTPEQGSLFN